MSFCWSFTDFCTRGLRLIVQFGQRRCIAPGERTVISSGVQPSMRMTTDWPETSPPSGTACTVRMPLLRATGSNSLSGLMLEAARAFGLIVPVSSMSTVARGADLDQAQHAVRADEARINVFARCI